MALVAATRAAVGRKPPRVGHALSKRSGRRMPASDRQIAGSVVWHVVVPLRLLDLHRGREGSQHGGLYRCRVREHANCGGVMVDERQALLNRLARLKTDRARGDPAPHKPLLLLAVMDLIESGRISSAVIPLSAE